MMNGRKSIIVYPSVIKKLEKLQAYYHYKNGRKMSYGEIVDALVTSECISLGIELNEEMKEMEAIA
ncbi:MAG: hypothetical protein J7K61_03150 [Thermoplasmata archaeon]|nr:hypothetical protein [Thermoplasmata archaeon]